MTIKEDLVEPNHGQQPSSTTMDIIDQHNTDILDQHLSQQQQQPPPPDYQSSILNENDEKELDDDDTNRNSKRGRIKILQSLFFSSNSSR